MDLVSFLHQVNNNTALNQESADSYLERLIEVCSPIDSIETLLKRLKLAEDATVGKLLISHRKIDYHSLKVSVDRARTYIPMTDEVDFI